MFNKVALLAFVAPLVAALTLEIPKNPTSGGTITIQWTSAPGDPSTFSIELVNDSFHNAFAIANNVQPTQGQITLQLPVVPVGSGYTLEAVDIGNIGNVFATTGSFSIGANADTSTTSSTSTSTGTGTTPTSTSPVTTPSPTTTSHFGTTVSNTLSTSSSGTGTSTTTHATTSSAAMAPLKINSNIGAFAAVVFSAIAGAAIVAL